MTQVNNHFYVVIMAGGVGSRFWPASRETIPKQFLDLTGVGKSLIRNTYDRFESWIDNKNIFVVTNKNYKNATMEHIPQLAQSNIICEPTKNNTAPCIALASLKIASIDSEATIIVVPSDHIILKESLYIKIVQNALLKAHHSDHIITLGIKPTRPDTGYGYIEIDKPQDKDYFKVSSFKEKPQLEDAQIYLESGKYLWNAGMFVWKVSSILSAFQQFEPQILDSLMPLTNYFNSELEQVKIDEYYPHTKKISIDFAIMEKVKNVYTIPADISWSDLGTWKSMHQFVLNTPNKVNEHSEENLATFGMENSQITNCDESIIYSFVPDKINIIKGLKGFIVVDTIDALLIYPIEEEQNIKQAIAKIEPKYK